MSNLRWAHRIRATAPTLREAKRLLKRVKRNPAGYDEVKAPSTSVASLAAICAALLQRCMAEQPTLHDFQEALRRIGKAAVRELERRIAAIRADAAAKGTTNNSRVVFLYTDALEECWNTFADGDLKELRRWVLQTNLPAVSLRAATETELRSVLARLITVADVRTAAGRFQNRVMLTPAIERLDALEDDLVFRLRQFDIEMDSVRRPSSTDDGDSPFGPSAFDGDIFDTGEAVPSSSWTGRRLSADQKDTKDGSETQRGNYLQKLDHIRSFAFSVPFPYDRRRTSAKSLI